MVLVLDAALVFLPVTRRLMTWLRARCRWISWEKNVFFHRMVALAILLFTIIHFVSHMVWCVGVCVSVLMGDRTCSLIF